MQCLWDVSEYDRDNYTNRMDDGMSMAIDWYWYTELLCWFGLLQSIREFKRNVTRHWEGAFSIIKGLSNATQK